MADPNDFATSNHEDKKSIKRDEYTKMLDDDDFLEWLEGFGSNETLTTESGPDILTDMEMGTIAWSDYSQAVRQAALARRIFQLRFDPTELASWSDEKIMDARTHDVIIGIIDSEAEAVLSRDLEQRLSAGYISTREYVRAFPEVDVSDITSDIGGIAMEMDWTSVNEISGLANHKPVSYHAWVVSNRSRSDLNPASLPSTRPASTAKTSEIKLKRPDSILKGGARTKLPPSLADSDSESEDVWLKPKTPRTQALESPRGEKKCPLLSLSDSRPSKKILDVGKMEDDDYERKGKRTFGEDDGPLHKTAKISKSGADIERRIDKLQKAGLVSKRSYKEAPTKSEHTSKRAKHCATEPISQTDEVRSESILPTKNFFEFQAQLIAEKAAAKQVQTSASSSSAFWSSSPSRSGNLPDSSMPPGYISSSVETSPKRSTSGPRNGDNQEARSQMTQMVKKFLDIGRSVEAIVTLVQPLFPTLKVDDWEGLVVEIENEQVIERLMNAGEEPSEEDEV